MSFYRAEYIWIDGTKPTAKLRSKTKIVPAGEKPAPPPPDDPEELPAKQQPPAHKGGPRVPPTKIWDEESQAFLDTLDKDRKQADASDYHQPDGGPVTRGDEGPD